MRKIHPLTTLFLGLLMGAGIVFWRYADVLPPNPITSLFRQPAVEVAETGKTVIPAWASKQVVQSTLYWGETAKDAITSAEYEAGHHITGPSEVYVRRRGQESWLDGHWMHWEHPEPEMEGTAMPKDTFFEWQMAESERERNAPPAK